MVYFYIHLLSDVEWCVTTFQFVGYARASAETCHDPEVSSFMLPVMLDLSRLRLALIGAGPAAIRRLERLDAAGAEALAVYAPGPDAVLRQLAGSRLVARLPAVADLAGVQFAFIAGLGDDDIALAASRARTAGAIVHVEDAPEASGAQMPAVFRRGDLTIAVSTGGRSPALAVEIKNVLARIFGPEWALRLAATAAVRERWRRAGHGPESVRQRTVGWLTERGWLASGTGFESNWTYDAANDPAKRRIQP